MASEFLLGREYSPDMNNCVAADGRVRLREGFESLGAGVLREEDGLNRATINGMPATINGEPLFFTAERGFFLVPHIASIDAAVAENLLQSSRTNTIDGETYFIKIPPSKAVRGYVQSRPTNNSSAPLKRELPVYERSSKHRSELDILPKRGDIGEISAEAQPEDVNRFFYDRSSAYDAAGTVYDQGDVNRVRLASREFGEDFGDETILRMESYQDSRGEPREVIITSQGIYSRQPMLWIRDDDDIQMGMRAVKIYEFDTVIPQGAGVWTAQGIDEQYKDLFVSVETKGLFRVKLDSFPSSPAAPFERHDAWVTPVWTLKDYTDALNNTDPDNRYEITDEDNVIQSGQAQALAQETKIEAKALLARAGRLIGGNITNAGNRYPYQIIWTPAGRLEEFESADLLETAGAGYLNLLEDTTGGEITGIHPLGETALAVFKERAVYLLTPAGGGYAASLKSDTHGKAGYHGACAMGGSVVFVSRDDVMVFDGSSIRPLLTSGSSGRSGLRTWLRARIEQGGSPECVYVPDRGSLWIFFKGDRQAASIVIRDRTANLHTMPFEVSWAEGVSTAEMRVSRTGRVTVRGYERECVIGGEKVMRMTDAPFDDGEAFPAHCRTARTDLDYEQSDDRLIPAFMRAKRVSHWFADIAGEAYFRVGFSPVSFGEIEWSDPVLIEQGNAGQQTGVSGGDRFVCFETSRAGAGFEWNGYGVGFELKEYSDFATREER